MTKFEHVSYHLDLFCPKTRKYKGSINITQIDMSRAFGYEGRRLEKINAKGRKGMKDVKFNGEYITQYERVSGRIVGDRFNNKTEIETKVKLKDLPRISYMQ